MSKVIWIYTIIHLSLFSLYDHNPTGFRARYAVKLPQIPGTTHVISHGQIGKLDGNGSPISPPLIAFDIKLEGNSHEPILVEFLVALCSLIMSKLGVRGTVWVPVRSPNRAKAPTLWTFCRTTILILVVRSSKSPCLILLANSSKTTNPEVLQLVHPGSSLVLALVPP